MFIKKLLILIIFFSFVFITYSFALNDKPRLLTVGERQEICKSMNDMVKALQINPINGKKGYIKCLDKRATIIQIVMDGMTEKEANNFFGKDILRDFGIAGYKEIYFENLTGDRWIIILENKKGIGL